MAQPLASRLASKLVALSLLCFASGCTIYHSRQADFATVDGQLEPTATFITEEDSGLSLLGIFVITEPDHFSVLLDRAQRRYNCSSLRFAQLDFYTDHWVIVAFPISRVTLVCEPPKKGQAAEAPTETK
jgi:hypothetical protein